MAHPKASMLNSGSAMDAIPTPAAPRSSVKLSSHTTFAAMVLRGIAPQRMHAICAEPRSQIWWLFVGI